jgi:uncharacterized protein
MKQGKPQINVTTFFILTFTLSWLIWIPLVLSHFHLGLFSIPENTITLVRLLGVLMPAVSAIVLSSFVIGKTGLRQLFSGFRIWNAGLKWWAAAALLQPALLILAGLIQMGFGKEQLIRNEPTSFMLMAVNIFFLLLATLGEEIGWHGLALPLLQESYSPLKSSLILGILWGLWHVPFWLLLDTFTQFGFGYLALKLLMVLPMTVIVTWFFNNGHGSLLLPVAFHFVFNLVNVIWLPVTLSISAFVIYIIFEWLLALLVFRYLEPAIQESEQ